MITPSLEIDDDALSSGPFSTRQHSNILLEHTRTKGSVLSPLAFFRNLSAAAANHRTRSGNRNQQQGIHRLDDKSKNIGKGKNITPSISAIFKRPKADVADSLDVAAKASTFDELEAAEQRAQQTVFKSRIFRDRAANVTVKRGEKRIKKTHPSPVNIWQSSLAKDHTENMSKHDYNFTQAETVPIGGKQIASRSYHTSNAIDTNFGSDSAYRQQLQEMAASMASLCNIGNSCYMNSVIYTLRYTPLFMHNLHHLVSDFAQIFNQKENQQKLKSASLGRNVNGLQGSNARSYSSKDLVSLGSSSSSTVSLPTLEIVKTTQHKASEKLHELFQCLSNNENGETTEPYQSDIFLKAIQDVNPIFEGNQQQDAHEFLMCILDSIRETCQSLKKNVIEHPEIIMQG